MEAQDVLQEVDDLLVYQQVDAERIVWLQVGRALRELGYGERGQGDLSPTLYALTEVARVEGADPEAADGVPGGGPRPPPSPPRRRAGPVPATDVAHQPRTGPPRGLRGCRRRGGRSCVAQRMGPALLLIGLIETARLPGSGRVQRWTCPGVGPA